MSESREDFAARLRRTLRVAPAALPEAAAPRPALPEWYLRRVHRQAERALADPAASSSAHRARSTGLPPGLTVESNARGSYAVRLEHLPADHLHGSTRLSEVLAARGAPLALLSGDAALEGFDPRTSTFLDIETTGLSGGAGTQVFQIGLLHFAGTHFELWQGFLRSPGEAPALLQACADRVRLRGALVSFFGKSFDRHRLEDQMRLHHVEPPFQGRAHLDLYHPCRRLYGSLFADARLATMERELCGVQREGDLPGAFAPAAWFDFLAGREHLLEAVFLHNRLDVLSLACLCAHVARVLDDDAVERSAPRTARERALTQLFASRRDWPRVLQWSERALESDSASRPAAAARARALERCGRREEARALFESLADTGADGLAAESCGEVARLAGRAGEHAAAATACDRAEQLGAASLTGTRAARLTAKLAGVRARLAKAESKEKPAESRGAGGER